MNEIEPVAPAVPVAHPDRKPTIPEVMPALVAYMRVVGIESVMHDGNIEDAHIDYDIADCELRGDGQGAEVYRLLRRMSRTQRGKIRERLWVVWREEGR